jgi:CrcB protein
MGSFAFGLVFAAARDRGGLSTEVETILLVGLLGGFTTYSSFAFQAAEMLEHGRLPAAAAYVLATNMAGIAAVWLGLRAGAA